MPLKNAEVFVELWLDELCRREPKDGPATMRRWYLALTSGRRADAANDNGAEIDRAAAAKLADLCRKCPKRCALPLV
jgi:hypothetical protein